MWQRNTSNVLLVLYCNLIAHVIKEYLKCLWVLKYLCNLVTDVTKNTSNALKVLYCNLVPHLTKEYLKTFYCYYVISQKENEKTWQKFPINSTNSPNPTANIQICLYYEWSFKWSWCISLEINNSDLNVNLIFAHIILHVNLHRHYRMEETTAMQINSYFQSLRN